MAISLTKGANVSLSKTDPGLQHVLVGLGWDARGTDGAAFDLDASVFMLKADGKVRSDKDFIFYNNLVAADGSVKHTGDNTTGVGDGDDESIEIQLAHIAPDIAKMVFAVTIHEADVRRQNFGMVNSAFIRIVNKESNAEIARFDLSEEASIETAMIFGEIYRHNAEWKFKAVGQGFKGGLGPLARSMGVNIT